MTTLVPMSAETYTVYLQYIIKAYAEDNVASGRWPAEGALERSHLDFEKSLPQGLSTPDNYLFEIKQNSTGPTVGVLWFAVIENQGSRSAFVYDLEIKEAFRRQGHAQKAFEALEALVLSMGLNNIGLHVFGHNLEAQALYSKLGYKITGINMAKSLSAK